MRLSNLPYIAFRFLLPAALSFTLCLYIYAPLIGCAFPLAKPGQAGCSVPGSQRNAVPAQIAPFRLLAFGDPQLEGDTSLPDHHGSTFTSWEELREGPYRELPSRVSRAARSFATEDVPKLLRRYRKTLDLWGNDLYLAHIYRSVSWWSKSTHVVALGDLLGSQWIGNEDFARRTDRFWKTVFRGSEKVPRAITQVSGRTEMLGQDRSWERKVIAVAGNHDIGYAGDIDTHRIERFEQAFGAVNWDIRFRLNDNTSAHEQKSAIQMLQSLQPSTPELRVIILNSMNLDDPAKDEALRDASRNHLLAQQHAQPASPNTAATVLLTHIPLHKEAGVCADAPFFDYFDNGGTIKEQNHLSPQSSSQILDVLRAIGSKAIILNGHDHEGCDTYHHRSSDDSKEPKWQAQPWRHSTSEPLPQGIREITVRSMMGSYGGNAGFLSGWFDHEEQEWKFEYASCSLGVQHIWWAVHVLDLVVVVLGVVSLAGKVWDTRMGKETERRKEKRA